MCQIAAAAVLFNRDNLCNGLSVFEASGLGTSTYYINSWNRIIFTVHAPRLQHYYIVWLTLFCFVEVCIDDGHEQLPQLSWDTATSLISQPLV